MSETHAPTESAAAALFQRGGEVGALCRELDWSATPLGPVTSWSASLRVMAGAVLASPVPLVVLWGPELIQIYNDACRVLLGVKHPAALGRPMRESWPETWEFERPICEAVLERGESFAFEDQPMRVERNGYPEEVLFTLSYSPVPDDDGSVGGVLLTVVETTERVQTREALRERERTARQLAQELAQERGNLAAVIEELPFGIALVRPDGRVRSLNRAACELHGYDTIADMPTASDTYEALFELQTLDGRPLRVEEWPVSRALRGDFPRQYEIRLHNRKLGRTHVVCYDVIPVQNDAGAVELLVFVMQDLTTRKETEEALRRSEERTMQLLASETAARKAAEQSSRVKSQFLSVISHELRTPLTAVLGYTDLLDAEVVGPVNAEQKKYLSRIRASTSHLVSIIDEILTFSRTEAGREEVRLAEEDVAAVARTVVGMLAHEARARGLALTLRGADAPVVAHTDGGKVSQILVNLVGNALKYTDDGRVDVTLHADDASFELRVSDTGPGIPADRVEDVFEPFVQLDPSNTRTRGGTGLGLAICRRLAHLLGGDVTLQSTVGEGSTFTARLPRGAV